MGHKLAHFVFVFLCLSSDIPTSVVVGGLLLVAIYHKSLLKAFELVGTEIAFRWEGRTNIRCRANSDRGSSGQQVLFCHLIDFDRTALSQ